MGCWQDLPSDLVRSIAERLSGVDDFFRLGAVCRPWSEALLTSKELVLMSPDFPWLVPTSVLTSKEVLMYSPNNHRLNRFPVPTPLLGVGFTVVGCHRGWLVTVDDNALDVHIFNPVTGDRASANLPSFSTLTINASALCIKKVALSSIPPCSSEVVAAAAVYSFENSDAITFAKAGDNTWSGSIALPSSVTDVIYYRGNFFVIDYHGRYQIIDPSGPEPWLVVAARIPPMFPYDDDFYRSSCGFSFIFVLSPSSGHLLVVGRVEDSQSTTRRFVVIKYNPYYPSSSRWVEIKDLGDEALFLGVGQAMFAPSRWEQQQQQQHHQKKLHLLHLRQ